MAECGQVVSLFGTVHALGGEHADCGLLGEEVVDEGAGDAVVEELFFAGKEGLVMGVGLDELAERVAVDVVVHLAADHGLVEVEALAAAALGSGVWADHAVDDAAGLAGLQDEGEDEPDDVRHHVAVLQLLRLLRRPAHVALGLIVFVL